MASKYELVCTAIRNNDKRTLSDLIHDDYSTVGDHSELGVESPLELAISLQNLDIAKYLLHTGASLKTNISIFNPTALHCAVLEGRKPIIAKLLRHQVDFRATDSDGATVLHMVFDIDEMPKPKKVKLEVNLEQEIIEIIKMFLNLQMDVNVEMHSGETPLYLALKKGMIEVAGFLVERGANVNTRDQLGNSALHLLINDEIEPYLYEDNTDAFAQKDNATFASWLICRGLNPNYKNAKGEVPIDLAVEYKLKEMLLVLAKHVNVNYINGKNESILHVFIKMFQDVDMLKDDFLSVEDLLSILEDLIRRRAPVNVVDSNGQTLFHAAIQLKSTRILLMIAERFVNVRACNSEGETVLHALISRCIDDERDKEAEYARIALILQSKGADPNARDKRGLSPVHLAAQYKFARILEAFRECGADMHQCTPDGEGILHVAAAKLSGSNDAASVEHLISLALAEACDVDQPNAKGGYTPLQIAAICNNLTVVRSLLGHGAQVDRSHPEQGFTALHMAAVHDDAPMIELLAGEGASMDIPSCDGSTPLHLAVKSASLEAVGALVRCGASLSRCSPEVGTALHLAVIGECKKVLELLIDSGADLNAPNQRGQSPLLWGICYPTTKLEMLELLLQFGPDAKCRDRRDGASSLHLAVRHRKSHELFDLLLKYGADIDARLPGNGNTIMHELARVSLPETGLIRMLLRTGLSTEARNLEGFTPLQVAVRERAADAIGLMLRHGFRPEDLPEEERLLMKSLPSLNTHLINHLLKLDAADLPMSNEFASHLADQFSVRLDPQLAESLGLKSNAPPSIMGSNYNRDQYRREVLKMKATYLDERVSVHDLLLMDPLARYHYLKNFPEWDYVTLPDKFSHYDGLIWRALFEVAEKKALWGMSHQALQKLGRVILPEICVETIFALFRNDDLKNLIAAANDP